jgi:hypothetical protein
MHERTSGSNEAQRNASESKEAQQRPRKRKKIQRAQLRQGGVLSANKTVRSALRAFVRSSAVNRALNAFSLFASEVTPDVSPLGPHQKTCRAASPLKM